MDEPTAKPLIWVSTSRKDLHVFQKKSKRGIQTPRPDMDMIETRLKQAQEIQQRRTAEGGNDEQ